MTSFFFQSNLMIMFFHMLFPRHIRYPTPLFYNLFKIQRSSQHLIIMPSQNIRIPSHSTSPGQSILSIFQIQQTQKFWASFLNLLNSTQCSYHCLFSSQNCHFILPQTPCLAPIQPCRSCTALMYSFFYL